MAAKLVRKARIVCPNQCPYEDLEKTDDYPGTRSYICGSCGWEAVWRLGVPGLEIRWNPAVEGQMSDEDQDEVLEFSGEILELV